MAPLKPGTRTAMVALVCGLCLSACSIPAPLAPDSLPPATGAVNVERVWSSHLGSALAYLNFKSAIATDAQRVYSCSNHKLAAIDKASGALVWQQSNSASYSACVVLRAGTLYTGDSHGWVRALDASDGSQLWANQLASGLYHLPQGAEDKLLLLSEDAQLYLLNASTGARIITLEGSREAISLQGASAPAYSADRVYYSQSGNNINAMQLSNGQIVWQQQVRANDASTRNRIRQVRSDLHYHQGRVYALGYQGNMVALDAQSGAKLWDKNLSSSIDFSIDEQFLYLLDGDSSLVKLNANTGIELWRNASIANRGWSQPLVLAQMLVLSDAYGYLHFFHQDDGAYLASKKISPYAIKSLSADNQALYALDAKGWLQKLQLN